MFSLTIFSGHGYWSLPSLFSIAFMISQLKGDRRGAGLSSDHFGSTTLEDSQTKLSYLSLFKGSNMLLTCICILAIDFKVMLIYAAFSVRYGYFVDISSAICQN